MNEQQAEDFYQSIQTKWALTIFELFFKTR